MRGGGNLKSASALGKTKEGDKNNNNNDSEGDISGNEGDILESDKDSVFLSFAIFLTPTLKARVKPTPTPTPNTPLTLTLKPPQSTLKAFTHSKLGPSPPLSPPPPEPPPHG